MSISIAKRNSNPLDISINSKGEKLIYTTKPQKEPPQIKISIAKSDEPKEDTQNKSAKITVNTPERVPLPPKNENECQIKNFSPINHINSSTKDQPIKTQENHQKMFHSTKKEKSLNKGKVKEWHKVDNQKHQFNRNDKNLKKQTSTQDFETKEDKFFSRSFKKEYEYNQKIQDKNADDDSKQIKQPQKITNIYHQKKYIQKSQNIINNINEKTSFEFFHEMKDQIKDLNDMIKTMISFDDSLLKESKILISIINLFINDAIGTTSKFKILYSIFFDEDILMISPKLYQYFNFDSNQDDRSIIIKFFKKLFIVRTDSRDEIFNFFKSILNSKELRISNEIVELVNKEIDELENEIVLNEEKKQFVFNKDTINQQLKIEDLTNNYKESWSSINSYIKVMYNLTTENFFYAFRQHLEELKNDELDPRDLHLYEKVKIVPCYSFNNRSGFDLYINFSLRAPNYKENGQIKKHQLSKIDWEFTDRLSNRSLLFFSLSPIMETIDCVAISKAKKGTIQNNTIPICFLQGTLDFDKEYFMFEPIEHWNGPFYNNLLNTSQMTLPKSLIKPIISLDFSDNLVNNNDLLFNIYDLFKNKGNSSFIDYKFESTDADVQYYCQQIISTLELPTTNKDTFLRSLMNNLPHYLKNLEIERGNDNVKINNDSEIVKKVSLEIKKMQGFKSADEKWLFDDFSPEEFQMDCIIDHEQYKPFKYVLNHYFTLVNGNPGTGKTYLACQLVKFLINSNYKYPILVVTYKNVSLDGFLTNIIDFLIEKKVDFIRIGGKPRTENKYILDRQFDESIPADVQKIKGQIMFLISMKINIKNCLEQLETNPFIDSIKLIINELDKCICIKRIMFDMFPFYNTDEELIITHFLNPISCIPQAENYLNCWISGQSYYNELKTRLHEELLQKYDKILKIFDDYLKNKENDEKNEIISEIIVNHFLRDEKLFYNFLQDKRRKIETKDYSLFNDILCEMHDDPYTLNPLHDSNKLKNYITISNPEILPNKVYELIKQNFSKLLSSSDKINSFKKFLNDLMPLMNKYIKILRERCSEKQKEFEKKQIIELGNELSTKTLIAMTATRAAQFKASLDRSNVHFMIIEEAGELTESMAFSIIPKSTQNLLMIGDYRQLRPTVEYKLSFSPYNYDISLFEKEITHAKSIKSENLFNLSIQRRMHPQISSLLRRVFYNNEDEKLNDDETTQKIEKPIGFPNHIQFWLHEFEEEKENLKMRSHVNIQEAKVCAYLFMMMLCRGYKSSEITIVSLYKGQKRQIEKELMKIIDKYYDDENQSAYDAFDFENDWSDIEMPPRDLDELIEFRKTLVGRYVKCLDDFQGEENEVIIISLTRSEKPGFVKNQNRALVTLSRAKQMEFVIGNKNVFGPQNKKNPLWQRISAEAIIIDDDIMHFNGISACCCPIHNKNENKTLILNKPGDFFDCKFNCCKENCPCCLECGHQCKMPCHFHTEIMSIRPDLYKIFKRRYFCNEQCEKFCKNGHQCDDLCGNCSHFGCPPCNHKCESRCSLCTKRCSLNCCHPGKCQCQFTGFCTKCRNKIIDLHGNVKFLNGQELVCNNCYKKYNAKSQIHLY